jgi:hypothetical protein
MTVEARRAGATGLAAIAARVHATRFGGVVSNFHAGASNQRGGDRPAAASKARTRTATVGRMMHTTFRRLARPNGGLGTAVASLASIELLTPRKMNRRL